MLADRRQREFYKIFAIAGFPIPKLVIYYIRCIIQGKRTTGFQIMTKEELQNKVAEAQHRLEHLRGFL